MDKHYKNITLLEMCDIMGVPLPQRMQDKADLKVTHIGLVTKQLKKDSVFMLCRDKTDVKKKLDEAMSKQVSVIFIPQKLFSSSGLNENDYPLIFMDDWLSELGNFFSTIRRSYPATTVAITGSVGKTTTKDFISTILKDEQNFFSNTGNRNSFFTVAKHITDEMTDDLDTYIQEIGAGGPLSIEKSAVMLQPDYFVLLNVKNHHLNTYKTFEALFSDKTCVDRHMPAHGKVITNFDDDAIANHTFAHPVVSFGINTQKEVDYRAVNIREGNETLSFDVVSNTETIHLEINILGRHNVYNALAAFVLAKELGIPSKRIAEKFQSYKTSGIRQNYKNYGGYHLLVDCYNVAFDSIEAGINIMDSFELSPGARRFAVIGGENKLGKNSPAMSYQFGQEIADANVDFFYCYGQNDRSVKALNVYGDGKSICDGINSKKEGKAEFFTDPALLIERLKRDVKYGDIVFFKGIFLLDLPYVVDNVFGSSFIARSDYYKKDSKMITSDSFVFKKMPLIDELEICKSKKKAFTLRIPEVIDSKKVYRISEKAFANNFWIFNIVFNTNIFHIAESAFTNCIFLQKLQIPSNVLVIEKQAFKNCKNLKEVTLEDGVRHIGMHTFMNCKKLEKVFLPDSIGFIDKTAFENCSANLTLYCSKGSYAERYAIERNLNYCLL